MSEENVELISSKDTIFAKNYQKVPKIRNFLKIYLGIRRNVSKNHWHFIYLRTINSSSGILQNISKIVFVIKTIY